MKVMLQLSLQSENKFKMKEMQKLKQEAMLKLEELKFERDRGKHQNNVKTIIKNISNKHVIEYIDKFPKATLTTP